MYYNELDYPNSSLNLRLKIDRVHEVPNPAIAFSVNRNNLSLLHGRSGPSPPKKARRDLLLLCEIRLLLQLEALPPVWIFIFYRLTFFYLIVFHRLPEQSLHLESI